MELAVGLGVDEMTDIYAKAQVHANRFNRYPCQTECFVSSEKKNKFVTQSKAHSIPHSSADPRLVRLILLLPLGLPSMRKRVLSGCGAKKR